MKAKENRASDTAYYDEWARHTSLFQEWEAMKEDVLRHKWFQSEKAGQDVGWDRALVDYNLRVRRGARRPPRM
jgi:hypothetical protein